MNKGKAKCDKLKEIRRAIAKANNIDYNPSQCTFEGDCDGTCPRCDTELEQLNKLLAQKEAKGEKVIIPSTEIETGPETETLHDTQDQDKDTFYESHVKGHLIVLKDNLYVSSDPELEDNLKKSEVIKDDDEESEEDTDEGEWLMGDVIFEDELFDADSKAEQNLSEDIQEENVQLIFDPELGDFKKKSFPTLNGLVDDDTENKKDKPIEDLDKYTGFA